MLHDKKETEDEKGNLRRGRDLQGRGVWRGGRGGLLGWRERQGVGCLRGGRAKEGDV